MTLYIKSSESFAYFDSFDLYTIEPYNYKLIV